MNLTPVAYACPVCGEPFVAAGTRWLHLKDVHAVSDAERLYLTQGDYAAQAEFERFILQARAKRMAEGQS